MGPSGPAAGCRRPFRTPARRRGLQTTTEEEHMRPVTHSGCKAYALGGSVNRWVNDSGAILPLLRWDGPL